MRRRRCDPPVWENQAPVREILSVTEARQLLAQITRRIQSTGDRVVLEEHGRPVAAVVSASDIETLEALEDRLDLLDALDALADYRSSGGVSLEEVKANLGR